MVTAREVVIYDGECGLCRALQQRAARLDVHRCLEFVPYQIPDLERVVPGLTVQMAQRELYLVRADGRRWRGARAFFRAMSRLPGFWGLVGTLFAFPLLSLLAEPFYRLVARNRRRISQALGLNACGLEHPQPGAGA